MHKVRIESIGGVAKVSIDGKVVKTRKIDVHMEHGYVPETDIELLGEPDLEYESLITYDFSPKTVKCAVEVMKAALRKNDFVAFMGMSDLNKIMEGK